MATLLLFFLFAATTVSTHGSNEIASARLHAYEEIMNFIIDPAEIGRRQDKCEESYSFMLNEVSWAVKVCNYFDDSMDFYASIELVSNFTGDTEIWSCEAEATVKLQSPEKKRDTLGGKFKSFTYSKANPSTMLKKFVKWTDLIANYTANGLATFEFVVKANVPNRSPKSEQISTKFQVRAKQVRSLGEQYSNELVVHGIRWKVLTSKLQDNLAVFICANDNDIELTKSWKASATIKLLHADKEKSVSKPISETTIDWTQTQFGKSDFMKWDAFTSNENQYVKNNAAIFDIELNVKLNAN